jgi:alkylated DNA repair dioxygenase AlkB
MASQMALFGEADAPLLPDGMRYVEALITESEEQRLAAFIAGLPLEPFEFTGGYKGNRRVLSFGSRYDYANQRVAEAPSIPSELLGARQKAATFAKVEPESLQQALVTEYAPGAGIGWHRDRPHYGDIIGISLLAPCTFRLRLKTGNTWQRSAVAAAARSAYILSGESRSAWEHSIPPLDRLRYSVTFRTLRVPSSSGSEVWT